jgi:hypothetical protein
MAKRRPVLITVIAFVQIIPILLLPPKILLSMNRLFLVPPLVLFALLAWALLTWRPAGRTMTIFLQGFNIIVRLLIAMSKTVPSKAPGTPVDVPLLVTSVASIILSVLILFYVDQPEMQLLFEA